MLSVCKSIAAILVASVAVVGCGGKSGYQKAELTSKRLSDTKAELTAARAEVVNSVETLNALVNNPAADLRPQYQTFSKSVDTLERRVQRSRDRATDMRVKRDEYIQKWRTEADSLTDPEMRERAYARMGETRTSFNDLAEKMSAVREATTPFMTNLRDLKQYLGTDLTRAGIDSVSDLIATVRADEKRLLAALDTASASLKSISDDLSPVAPAAATKPASETPKEAPPK